MNNNDLIFDLEKALTLETQIANRNLSVPNRYRVAILENEICKKTQSVVFVFKITNKNSFLKYCCPLTKEEFLLLSQQKYAPTLRSSKYLKVGMATFMENHYAYADIQFPLDGHAIDFMGAFDYIQRELEQFLALLDV